MENIVIIHFFSPQSPHSFTYSNNAAGTYEDIHQDIHIRDQSFTTHLPFIFLRK